jgi:hypothetical protein
MDEKNFLPKNNNEKEPSLKKEELIEESVADKNTISIDHESKQKIQEDSISEREKDLEKLKKLGEEKGIDVAGAIKDIETEIEQQRNQSRGNENKEKPREAAEIVLEKINKLELVDNTRRLAYVLREREEERFTPIVHPDAIQYLSAAAGNLEDMFSNKTTSVEDITGALNKIGGVMNAIGKDLPRPRELRDDPENLKRVAYAIRNIGESCHNIKTELSNQENKDLEKIASHFNKLVNVAEEAFGYVVKKRSLLENI